MRKTKGKNRDDVTLEVLRRIRAGEMGAGVPQNERQARQCMQVVLDAISTVIADSANAERHRLLLGGFGSFQLRDLPARQYNNPRKSGERVNLAPTRVVRFHPAKVMRQRVANTAND